MGVLIFTHDAQKYREGNFVEGGYVSCNPQVKDLTVIVHERNPKAKECLAWLPYIAHRMVFVCENPPNIKKNDAVIYDGIFKKQDYARNIDATLRWRDRNKAFGECSKVPIPLMLSFLKENNKDISLWRTLAKAFTNVPEDYQHAMIAYAHKPIRRMSYPKKKKSDETPRPFGVRNNDLHWETIVRQDEVVANKLRKTNKDSLPKGVKKKQQNEDGWL
tara:strand:+ start:1287 stop:1940 length:654 start_codon:yes stop_codon:yes gene_type:complete